MSQEHNDIRNSIMKTVRYEQLKRSNLILEMHQAREELIKKRTQDDGSEASEIADENNMTFRSSFRNTSIKGRSTYQGTRMHLSPDDINRLNESIIDDQEKMSSHRTGQDF